MGWVGIEPGSFDSQLARTRNIHYFTFRVTIFTFLCIHVYGSFLAGKNDDFFYNRGICFLVHDIAAISILFHGQEYNQTLVLN